MCATHLKTSHQRRLICWLWVEQPTRKLPLLNPLLSSINCQTCVFSPPWPAVLLGCIYKQVRHCTTSIVCWTLWWIVQHETSNIREMSSQLKPRERSSTNVSSLMSNFGLPTCPVSTLFGKLSDKTATCEHLVRLGNSHLQWQSQNINWKFLAVSRTASLLVCDTKWDTFCKARNEFSKRIVKFSVIAHIHSITHLNL